MRAACAILLWALVALPVHGGEINVTVTGIKTHVGRIYAGACSETHFLSKNFLTECPSIASVIADRGTVALALHRVPEGRFAVMVFHDLDDDGKLDFNFFGMPSEPGGFSGSDWLFFPTFDKAALDIGPATASIEIALR